MDTELQKQMEKDVRRKKRIATELAGEVHDLVEDRLWQDYENLPELAEKVVRACQAWTEAKAKLN